MSQSFKLFRLQQVDSQLDKVHARLGEIEAILGADEEIRAAKGKVEEAAEVKASAERLLRSAEDEGQAQQIKIDQNQAALYGGSVKGPKELQDLQSEAEALNRRLEVLENVQLDKMLAAEEAQSAENSASKELTRLEGEKAIEQGELGLERDQLREEAGRLSSEREAIVSGIDAKDMAVYDKLRISKSGLAVAKVKDKSCTACGTTLSEAMAQAARSPNELSYCSTCKRILYAG